MRDGFAYRSEDAAGVRPEVVVEGGVGLLGQRRLAGRPVVDAGVGDDAVYGPALARSGL